MTKSVEKFLILKNGFNYYTVTYYTVQLYKFHEIYISQIV